MYIRFWPNLQVASPPPCCSLTFFGRESRKDRTYGHTQCMYIRLWPTLLAASPPPCCFLLYFLQGKQKAPNIRSYTMYVYMALANPTGGISTSLLFSDFFWQGNRRTYGHIQCMYVRFWPTLQVASPPHCCSLPFFGREIIKHTVIYNIQCMYIRLWPTLQVASPPPCCSMLLFWQGNH